MGSVGVKLTGFERLVDAARHLVLALTLTLFTWRSMPG
jgi:hypothetical protein